jgi:hypothetical protein
MAPDDDSAVAVDRHGQSAHHLVTRPAHDPSDELLLEELPMLVD